jgi:ATP-binding cassette subfamily B protein
VPGQRLTASQRLITIVRAVLKKAPVLLVDEPVIGALEAESVRMVQDALEHLLMSGGQGGQQRQRTTLVVSSGVGQDQKARMKVTLPSC